MIRGEAGLEITQLERAASHQTKALAKLRQARDPARPLSTARRHTLMLDVLEHLVKARHLLQRAQATAGDNPALLATLSEQLTRLASAIENVDRLMQTRQDLEQGDGERG